MLEGQHCRLRARLVLCCDCATREQTSGQRRPEQAGVAACYPESVFAMLGCADPQQGAIFDGDVGELNLMKLGHGSCSGVVRGAGLDLILPGHNTVDEPRVAIG